jgi:hypothetical protein
MPCEPAAATPDERGSTHGVRPTRGAWSSGGSPGRGSRARAQSTLSAIREIAHGVRPPLLAAAGVIEALRAQGALATITVNLVGTPPRSRDNAEEAVYFACLEALQNVGQACTECSERHAPTALPRWETVRPDRGRRRRVRPHPCARGGWTDKHPGPPRLGRGNGQNQLDPRAGDRGGHRAAVARKTRR